MPYAYYSPNKDYDSSVLSLIFGILGIVLCFGFGIAAWVLGNKTLDAIYDGVVPPSRQKMAKAGKILGIVGTFLWIPITIFWLLSFGEIRVGDS